MIELVGGGARVRMDRTLSFYIYNNISCYLL